MKWMNSVRVLRVRPGDTIVVTVEQRLTQQMYAALHEQVKAKFPDNEVVVLSEGIDLGVVRAEEAA